MQFSLHALGSHEKPAMQSGRREVMKLKSRKMDYKTHNVLTFCSDFFIEWWILISVSPFRIVKSYFPAR